jgi:hypothetical protein
MAEVKHSRFQLIIYITDGKMFRRSFIFHGWSAGFVEFGRLRGQLALRNPVGLMGFYQNRGIRSLAIFGASLTPSP